MGLPGYPAESGRTVLGLLAEGRGVASIAHDLDVSDRAIDNRCRQDLIDRGEQHGLTTTGRTGSRQRGSGPPSSRQS